MYARGQVLQQVTSVTAPAGVVQISPASTSPTLTRLGNDPWRGYARVQQQITEKMRKSLDRWAARQVSRLSGLGSKPGLISPSLQPAYVRIPG